MGTHRFLLTLRSCWLVLLFTAATWEAVGQAEYRIWDMATRWQLDFQQSPPRIRQSGRTTWPYGSIDVGLSASSIASPCGQYLFGSLSGWNLLDRNQDVVPGSDSLDKMSYLELHPYDWLSYRGQRSLIIPQPLSRSRYWVFVTPRRLGAVGPLRYALVDWPEQALVGRVLRKAVALPSQNARAVTATHHANRKDFWVLTRDAATREYLAFLLTERGLDTVPVRSPGLYIPDTVGQVRFSPDGTRLASPAYTRAGDGGKLVVCLAQFNPRTGVVSQEQVIAEHADNCRETQCTNCFQNDYGYRGCEFSPNGQRLYLCTAFNNIPEFLQILQLDLTLPSVEQIKGSARPITPDPQRDYVFMGGMQLTPTGEILIVSYDHPRTDRMAIIKKPNELGPACQYAALGLQTLFYNYPFPYEAPPNIVNSMLLDTVAEIRSVGGCGSGTDTVQLWLANPGCAGALRWDFGDGTTAAAWFPRHRYARAGTYAVTATADDGRVFRRWLAYEPTTPGTTEVPNVFTPDHDGLNDTFLPVIGGGNGYQFRVFNRWGREIFTTTNPAQAWDGADATAGVYFYHVTANDCSGQPAVRRGTVTLVR